MSSLFIPKILDKFGKYLRFFLPGIERTLSNPPFLITDSVRLKSLSDRVNTIFITTMMGIVGTEVFEILNDNLIKEFDKQRLDNSNTKAVYIVIPAIVYVCVFILRQDLDIDKVLVFYNEVCEILQRFPSEVNYINNGNTVSLEIQGKDENNKRVNSNDLRSKINNLSYVRGHVMPRIFMSGDLGSVIINLVNERLLNLFINLNKTNDGEFIILDVNFNYFKIFEPETLVNTSVDETPSANGIIDPIRFAEDLTARRRQWIPIEIDYEALLNDNNMKEYDFPNATRSSHIDGIIFGEARRLNFRNAPSFQPITLFESKAFALYKYLTGGGGPIDKISAMKDFYISMMTSEKNIAADIRIPDQELKSASPFEHISEKTIQGQKVHLQSADVVKSGRRYPPYSGNPRDMQRNIMDSLLKLRGLEPVVRPSHTPQGLPFAIDMIDNKIRVALIESQMHPQYYYYHIPEILRFIRLTRSIIGLIDKFLSLVNMKIPEIDDVKLDIRNLEINDDIGISFQSIIERLQLSRDISLLAHRKTNRNRDEEIKIKGGSFLLEALYNIENPDFMLSEDDFWKSGSNILEEVINESMNREVFSDDLDKEHGRGAQIPVDQYSLFKNGFIPSIAIIKATDEQVLKDNDLDEQKYTNYVPVDNPPIINIYDLLLRYYSNIGKLSTTIGRLTITNPSTKKIIGTLTDEFSRFVRSRAEGIDDVKCSEVFFYKSVATPTTSADETIVDMTRFAEKFIDHDHLEHGKKEVPDNEIERSIYRRTGEKVKVFCPKSPDLKEDLLEYRKIPTSKALKTIVESVRVSRFTDLYNYFKAPGSKFDTKLQRYVKFISFVYLFFDPIPEARPVIDALIKSLTMMYYVYVKRSPPAPEKANPYEILAIDDFHPYNLSEILPDLIEGKSVSEVVLLVLGRTTNVSVYRNAILSLFNLLDLDLKDTQQVFQMLNVNPTNDTEVITFFRILLKNYKDALTRQNATNARDLFTRMSISSFVLPVKPSAEAVGMQKLISILFNVREDSLVYQLSRLTMVNFNEDDFNDIHAKIVNKYHAEYTKISGGSVAILDTVPLLSPINNSEYILHADVNTSIKTILTSLYSARITFVIGLNSKDFKFLSTYSMIKPCFVYQNLMTVALPYKAECEGYIDAVADPAFINYSALTSIFEYPAMTIRITNTDTFGPITEIGTGQAFAELLGYLPSVETLKHSGGMTEVIVRRDDPKEGAYKGAKEFRAIMHLVAIDNLADIVPAVVGYVNEIAKPNPPARLLAPRSSHTWTSTPLRASVATPGSIYMTRPLPRGPVPLGGGIGTHEIFLPAIDTDMFLSSFFSPFLQLVFLVRFSKVLEGSEADIRLTPAPAAPPGGAGVAGVGAPTVSSKTQIVSDLIKNLGNPDIDNLKADNLTISGLSNDNCKLFCNLLIGKIGTSLATDFDDRSLGYLTDIDMDREAMLFFSEQPTQRSLRYGVTFDGYMNLFRRRKGVLGKAIVEKTKEINSIQQLKDIKEREALIAEEIKRSNKFIDDPESHYLNEIVTKDLFTQEEF